ncbi:helix-turn-helix domain-containing protein [Roseateles sp.]|uniref:helix-turn-helix domain-containing protein n=1 Tax=Roseateles sp. TaxID=1971397 RepID=UPI00286B1A13|nr:RodZ domain-containing protein [Roseateles sp.]
MSSDLSEADQPLLAKAATGSSAGALLRELRSKQGLHIGAMAAMLKVPQAKLEALEADRWQDLPDVTFARALAKAMCGVLKVDATAVLALLPRGNESELMVSRGLNQAYREHDGRAEGLSLAMLQRPLVWGSLLLLLAAAAVYLMPAGWVERLSQPQPTAPEVIATPQANPPALEPTLIEPAVAASAVALEAVPLPLTSPVPTAASAPMLAAVVAPAGSVPLVVRITAESWVEVVDARGQVLLSRTLRAGEEQSLAGLPPLKVKVGNVAGTELLLRGSKVDLAGQSQNNVARLDLN